MTDYVLVAAERVRIERHIRLPSGVWTREERFGPEGVVRLGRQGGFSRALTAAGPAAWQIGVG